MWIAHTINGDASPSPRCRCVFLITNDLDQPAKFLPNQNRRLKEFQLNLQGFAWFKENLTGFIVFTWWSRNTSMYTCPHIKYLELMLIIHNIHEKTIETSQIFYLSCCHHTKFSINNVFLKRNNYNNNEIYISTIFLFLYFPSKEEILK